MMLHYSDLMYANATTFNDPFDCHPSLIDCSNVPEEKRTGWPANVIEELTQTGSQTIAKIYGYAVCLNYIIPY